MMQRRLALAGAAADNRARPAHDQVADQQVAGRRVG